MMEEARIKARLRGPVPFFHGLLALGLLTLSACQGLPNLDAGRGNVVPPLTTNVGAAQPATTSEVKQEKLIAAIKKLGGEVRMNPALLPDSPIVAIDLHQTRATDTDLEQLEGLPNLRVLNLYGTRITDAGLKHVGAIARLQTLYLNGTAVTDEGLRNLAPLGELKELSLYGTKVTDQGLSHLGNLKNLSDLTLGGKQITDRGLIELRAVKHLRRLFLTNTAVTKDGLAELHKAMPEVQIICDK